MFGFEHNIIRACFAHFAVSCAISNVFENNAVIFVFSRIFRPVVCIHSLSVMRDGIIGLILAINFKRTAQTKVSVVNSSAVTASIVLIVGEEKSILFVILLFEYSKTRIFCIKFAFFGVPAAFFFAVICAMIRSNRISCLFCRLIQHFAHCIVVACLNSLHISLVRKRKPPARRIFGISIDIFGRIGYTVIRNSFYPLSRFGRKV